MLRPVPFNLCLPLVHEFEQGPRGGFAPAPYLDPVGHPTIGYGHKISTADPLYGHTIDAARADELAKADLEAAAAALCVSLGADVTGALQPAQYAALIDWVFNLGVGAFDRSTLHAVLLCKRFDLVAKQINRWIFAGEPPAILPGLVTRRAAEVQLWTTGAWAAP